MQVLPQIIQLLSTPLGQRDPFLRIIYYSLYKYNNPRFKLKEVEGNSVNNNRLNEKKQEKSPKLKPNQSGYWVFPWECTGFSTSVGRVGGLEQIRMNPCGKMCKCLIRVCG